MTWLVGVVLSIVGFVLDRMKGKGPSAEQRLGREEAKAEVAVDALRGVEAARKEKEAADAHARNTDYRTRVDRL